MTSPMPPFDTIITKFRVPEAVFALTHVA